MASRLNDCQRSELMAQASAFYLSGLTIAETADATGLSDSACRRLLIDSGTTIRSRKVALALAVSNGRWQGSAGHGSPHSAEAKQKISLARRKWAESNAVGKSIKPNGYVEITRGPDKNKTEHRVIAARLMGRPLLRSEHVHHIDGNRSNNAPSNLLVLSHGEHSRLHRLQEHQARVDLAARMNQMNNRRSL